jgi:hypothetical protein
MVVNLQEFFKSVEEVRAERLREFIASNPENILIKGDKDHIILSMSFISGTHPPYLQGGHIYFRGDPALLRQKQYASQLSETTVSKLIADTSLETDTGRKIDIFSFAPPGPDGLGAIFIFKRRMSDGTSFISTNDKELRFKTKVEDRKIKVKFDLRKMIYRGQLEY